LGKGYHPDIADPSNKDSDAMSPHVNNFVTDLVEMAKAMDELPKVTAELHQTSIERDRALSTIQDRELHILDLKQQIETHLSIIRSLEVARDDAEMRFLEADDRAVKASSFLARLRDDATMVASEIDRAKGMIDPPKPIAPEANPPSTIQDQAVGQGADPLSVADGLAMSGSPSQTALSLTAIEPEPAMPSASGQSEADPTVSTTPSSVSEPQNAAPLTVPSNENVSSTEGKYSGKRYLDHPYYVSEAAWLAGGGTVESYYEGREVHKAY
jgi:hypothetical protein